MGGAVNAKLLSRNAILWDGIAKISSPIAKKPRPNAKLTANSIVKKPAKFTKLFSSRQMKISTIKKFHETINSRGIYFSYAITFVFISLIVSNLSRTSSSDNPCSTM